MSQLDTNLTIEEMLILIEASEKKKEFLVQKYKLEDPQIVGQLDDIDPTHGTFLEWLVKGFKANQFILPEDANKLNALLSRFMKMKNSPRVAAEFKDINRYASFSDLAEWLDNNEEKRSKGDVATQRRMEGAEEIYSSGQFKVVKVTTSEAGAELFKDTEWCVKDPRFFNEYKPPYYMVEANDAPYVLFHIPSLQCKNKYDAPVDASVGQNINFIHNLGLDIPPKGEFLPTFGKEDILKAVDTKSVEGVVALVEYCKLVVKGRWEEVEPLIASQANAAFAYARDIVRKPWAMGENAIASNAATAYAYAAEVLKKRFPAAEGTLIRSNAAEKFLYAKHIVKGRWPELEAHIINHPYSAMIYAVQILRERWPEAEEMIKKEPSCWKAYTNAFSIR